MSCTGDDDDYDDEAASACLHRCGLYQNSKGVQQLLLTQDNFSESLYIITAEYTSSNLHRVSTVLQSLHIIYICIFFSTYITDIHCIMDNWRYQMVLVEGFDEPPCDCLGRRLFDVMM